MPTSTAPSTGPHGSCGRTGGDGGGVDDSQGSLADSIYEYGNGEDRYGPESLVGVRDHEPPIETVTLSDYRLRHTSHKADLDSHAERGRRLGRSNRDSRDS